VTAAPPLAGIRVLEFSQAVAGPTCGRYLAEHGAEVIRVENARHPDNLRYSGSGWLPVDTPWEVVRDTRPSLSTFNAGKKSVGLDPSRPEGRDLVLRLAAVSDVVVLNLAAATAPSLGLGYEDLRQARADIIYCSLPAFGNRPSPYRDFKTWGPNLAALAGIDYLTGWPDRPPASIGNIAYVDFTGGFEAAEAILAAILRRDLTGEGIELDLAQYDAAVTCLGPVLMDFDANGHAQERTGNRVSSMAPHGIFPASGHDRWVAIAVEDDRQWRALCEVAAGEGFASDSRFLTARGRLEAVDELEASLSTWTQRFSGRETAHRLQAAGVPAYPALELADLAVDPQLESRGFHRLGAHARFGQDLFAAYPARLSRTPADVRSASPGLGQHNEYVLGRLLGLDEGERARLIRAGVVFEMPEAPPMKRPYTSWIRHFLRLEGWP
jgi:benzylsuccinate CoA-transferase BbsF subunit